MKPPHFIPFTIIDIRAPLPLPCTHFHVLEDPIWWQVGYTFASSIPHNEVTFMLAGGHPALL